MMGRMDMGKRFVLKDASGRPAGYVIADGADICCRVSGDGQGDARLIALFEDGERRAYALAPGGAEQRFPCGDGALCGGYVEAADRLLLATDARAREAFARSPMRRRAQPAAQARSDLTDAREQAMPPRPDETQQPDATARTDVMPQRRWPPPPCWPQARYAHGRWQDEL